MPGDGLLSVQAALPGERGECACHRPSCGAVGVLEPSFGPPANLPDSTNAARCSIRCRAIVSLKSTLPDSS